MACMVAILKMFFQLLLQTTCQIELNFGAEIGETSRSCTNFTDSISNLVTMVAILKILFSASSPEPLVGLSWNLMRSNY